MCSDALCCLSYCAVLSLTVNAGRCSSHVFAIYWADREYESV